MDLRKIKVIFTDCFDTLIYRDVRPDVLYIQWAKLIYTKYPEINRNYFQIYKTRVNTYKDIEDKRKQNNSKAEITYKEWMSEIYKQLEIKSVQENEFIKFCFEIEIALEKGCVYTNKKCLSFLIEQKKQNKKIVLLSDYYLGFNHLKSILESCGIDCTIFDDVFISADYGVTKRSGDLYDLAKARGYEPDRSLMIGDNKNADYIQAKAHGFLSVYKNNYFHKIKNRLMFELKILPNQQKNIIERLIKYNLPYTEYAFLLYVVSKRLYQIVKNDEDGVINFLSREGLILKKSFDIYLKYKPAVNYKTNYFLISRRSIQAGSKGYNYEDSVKNVSIGERLSYLGISKDEIKDKLEIDLSQSKDSGEYELLNSNKQLKDYINKRINSNYEILRNYIERFTTGNGFVFCDIGWKGTTQELIEKEYSIPTVGYYLGIQKDNNNPKEIKGEMHGLLFDERINSKYTPFLNTNISLYEQLLAAPHGTVIGYKESKENISCITEWDPMEKEIYEKYIKRTQQAMMQALPGIIAWEQNEQDEHDLWYLCKLIMRGTMFARGKKLEMAQTLNQNFVVGVQGGTRGNVEYEYKNIRIRPDVIIHPERYVKYITKVQRTKSFYDLPIIRIVYWMVAPLFYAYTCVMQFLNCKTRQK